MSINNTKFPKLWKPKPIKFNQPHFRLDTDKDGVLDFKDCRPFNPKKQHDVPILPIDVYHSYKEKFHDEKMSKYFTSSLREQTFQKNRLKDLYEWIKKNQNKREFSEQIKTSITKILNQFQLPDYFIDFIIKRELQQEYKDHLLDVVKTQKLTSDQINQIIRAVKTICSKESSHSEEMTRVLFALAQYHKLTTKQIAEMERINDTYDLESVFALQLIKNRVPGTLSLALKQLNSSSSYDYERMTRANQIADYVKNTIEKELEKTSVANIGIESNIFLHILTHSIEEGVNLFDNTANIKSFYLKVLEKFLGLDPRKVTATNEYERKERYGKYYLLKKIFDDSYSHINKSYGGMINALEDLGYLESKGGFWFLPSRKAHSAMQQFYATVKKVMREL